MVGNDAQDGPRLLVKKYGGRRGAEYTRWRKEFLDALEGKGDDDASLAMTALGTDSQAGLSPAQVKRRDKRRRDLYSRKPVLSLRTSRPGGSRVASAVAEVVGRRSLYSTVYIRLIRLRSRRWRPTPAERRLLVSSRAGFFQCVGCMI